LLSCATLFLKITIFTTGVFASPVNFVGIKEFSLKFSSPFFVIP
jgi:hypothetical protein